MIRGKMRIGGDWVEARSGAARQVINPFNQETIATVAEGDRQDARDAIRAARLAFDAGPWLPAAGRAGCLARLAGLVTRQREELAELETLDTGKTLEESRWDMNDVAGVFSYYAGLADPWEDEAIETPDAGCSSVLVREPVGVCAQILPWNYPLLQASWKLGPALAAGCTVVMKPSEITPLTTLRLTELALEAGVPGGVVNTVLGPGATVGAELAESAEVDLVSFTGGVATGKTIMRAAAGNVKRIALELGGKNPHIVFADADLEAALERVLDGVFFHAGQICSAGARLMLQDEIHDRFVEALAARVERIRLGDGREAGTQMGPLISAEHRAKVERHVAIAMEEGARLLCGGRRPEAVELAGGFFYLPTLLVDCEDGMRIVQEEVFGPVISVERFGSEEEVVRRANGTIYGLSAGFWSQDPERIQRVARALRFGTIWVNDFNVYFAQAPWGGYKQSGIGRELGRAGLDEYTEIKHLYRSRAPKGQSWFGV